MIRLTETTELSFDDLRHTRVVNAEVSDLVINQWNGASFVPSNTLISAGESADVITRGLRLQFVVIPGGAVTIEGVYNELD